MHELLQPATSRCDSTARCMPLSCFRGDFVGDRGASVAQRVIRVRLAGDESRAWQALSSKLPEEIWLLVLAWAGLRSSAAAACCSSVFRSAHRSVASTPALLARALLVDHGLTGAVANLYGSTAGHPHEIHAVHSDAGVAATLRDLVVLSAPPGVAVTAAAATATAASSAAAAVTALAAWEASSGVDAEGGGGASRAPDAARAHLQPALAALPRGIDSKAWPTIEASAFRAFTGGLLCAAAAAGHPRVAVTTLVLGAPEAVELNRALVTAAAAGRRRVVQLLLAAGADTDATEPFGPCALYEAARNGHKDVVELLLDTGARPDGAAAATATAVHSPPPLLPPLPQQQPYNSRPAAALPFPAADAAAAALPTWQNPGRSWPMPGGGGGGGGRSAIKDPVPLRAPLPLPLAAGVQVSTPRTSAGVQAFFFSDGSNDSTDFSRQPRRQQLDDPPGTPTAAAAAAAAAASAWSDDEDSDGLGSTIGRTGSNAGGGECAPRTPGARIACRAPPPLPRRKPTLPLPPLRTPLPLLPLLTSAPPLPPAMMLMLHGGFPPRAGPSPLLAACRAGHVATAALLLRRGAKPDTAGGRELLGAAHPDIVDELLAAVPSLAVHLDPALLAAASSNRPAVVSALLRHGADPCFRGGMPLTEAAFKGHVAVLEVLLAAGDARLRDCGALAAALDLARMWGRMEVMKLLAGKALAKAGP